MKKRLLFFVVTFIVGAIILEFIGKEFTDDSAEIDKQIILAVYKDNALEKELGTMMSYKINFDEIHKDSLAKFTLHIQGSKEDTIIKGKIQKINGVWVFN